MGLNVAKRKPKHHRGRCTVGTPKKRLDKALESLRLGSTMSEAAESAKMGRRTLYSHIERDAVFAKAVEDAIEAGTDVIEAAATRRAVVGVEEPVIFQGSLTFVGEDANGNPCDPLSPMCVKQRPLTVNKPSDVLAIFLLKGRRPKKFRDNATVTHQGPDGGPVKTETTHRVDYDAIEAELQAIACQRMAGGVPPNN